MAEEKKQETQSKIGEQMTEENKQNTKPQTSRTYTINSEQLMEIMRYLMSRPYGEVAKLMNHLSTLAPTNSDGGDNARKK